MFLDLAAARAAVDNAEDRAYRRAYSALSTSPGVLWWFVWFYKGYSVGALWPFLLVESLPGVSTSFLFPHLALAASVALPVKFEPLRMFANVHQMHLHVKHIVHYMQWKNVVRCGKMLKWQRRKNPKDGSPGRPI